jgi:hypothetical protein
MKNKKLLLISFILIFLVSLAGSLLRWDGYPPGYGLFPAQKVDPVPGFNEYYFLFACGVGLFFTTFLLFPSLFGFKKQEIASNVKEKGGKVFPAWFTPSIIILLVSWFFMWAPWPWAYPIATFTFVPLWWSFIFLLDAIVYYRNQGKSLIAQRPALMRIMAIASSFSWFVFEYENFFVLSNWYYPNNMILTNFGNITWQLASYTTVLPAIFEWYLLLRTFKKLDSIYRNGPKWHFSTPIQYGLLVLGLGLLFLMGYFPHPLFWVLWVCLVPVLVPAMTIKGYWTPFTPIGKGDWSYITLIGVATMLNGFVWEFWNYGSEYFKDYVPVNPNYWKYSVPYLDKWHIFSEMPLLGYFGYIFFGIVCWVLWLSLAYLLDFKPGIDSDTDGYNTP